MGQKTFKDQKKAEAKMRGEVIFEKRKPKMQPYNKAKERI